MIRRNVCGAIALGLTLLVGGALCVGICFNDSTPQGERLRLLGFVLVACGFGWLAISLREQRRKGR